MGDLLVNTKLPPPHGHYFDAAIGWLELGNPAEALAELNRLPGEYSRDPRVLELRWQSLARLGRWAESLPVAEIYCQEAPGIAQSWLHCAVSLYRAGRTQEAWNLLLPMAARFPRSWIVPYDLACYACQLGRTDEGRVWLKTAFRLHQSKDVRALALADPDLQILWPEIAQPTFESSSGETQAVA